MSDNKLLTTSIRYDDHKFQLSIKSAARAAYIDVELKKFENKLDIYWKTNHESEFNLVILVDVLEKYRKDIISFMNMVQRANRKVKDNTSWHNLSG